MCEIGVPRTSHQYPLAIWWVFAADRALTCSLSLLIDCRAFQRYVEVLNLLLEQPSINPNIQDEDGNTPLHLSVAQNQYDCVLSLWAKGSDPTACNNLKQKPIIVSEDQTMIRLITALEKKAGSGSDALKGQKKKKYQGSISRQSRAAKGEQSKKDMQAEGATNTTGDGGSR